MSDKSLIQRALIVFSTALVVVACAGAEQPAGIAGSPDDTASDGSAQRRKEPETRDDSADAGSPRAASAPAAELFMQMSVPNASIASEQSAVGMAIAAPPFVDPVTNRNREQYAAVDLNPVRVVSEHPVSTLSIDVDTGGYANVRRFLERGSLPPRDAVRVEEMVNYFSYNYPLPAKSGAPFNVVTELAPAPWNAGALLMQIGIKGFEVPAARRMPANLVFLIDVSGSMHSADKLPLLKDALRLLSGQLTARDSLAIVAYAGATGVVLEPTPGDERDVISAALDRLHAGGSTNGGAGIRLAYDTARASFNPAGINRVILATDGDFNVGTVNFEALIDLVERNRESGVSLTTLGFGTGNYNDHLMEQLADAGNGNHGYIDNLNEARKLLVTEVSSTLQTIAKDVKIQVEFNPAVVAEYRLIGYENRVLERQDFDNDRVDAGEIGAGHTVTALYEVITVGSPARRIAPLRYAPSSDSAAAAAGELAFVKLRYKAPGGDTSRLLQYPVMQDEGLAPDATSDSFRFAAAVAAFGQKLAGSEYIGGYGYDSIARLAASARGADRFGYREEFLALVDRAAALDAPANVVALTAGTDLER